EPFKRRSACRELRRAEVLTAESRLVRLSRVEVFLIFWRLPGSAARTCCSLERVTRDFRVERPPKRTTKQEHRGTRYLRGIGPPSLCERCIPGHGHASYSHQSSGAD